MTRRGRALAGWGAAQLALLVPLAAAERRMKATGGPGIIPFELAGPEHARRVLDGWGPSGRRAARVSLLLDYPFLVAYTGFNLALTTVAAEGLGGAGAGAVRAAQIAAAACEAAENTALLGVLARDDDEVLPRVARAFARAKFALLGAGWAYAAAGLASRFARSRR